MRPNSRGWGGVATERWQATPGACQRSCRATANCYFWTFDPVGYYGTTLCWTWVNNYPDEVK